MDILWSLFLGAVQGITEILPISSTAHLVLFPWFFNVPDQGLAFDVALHLGSLAAIIVAFWPEWVNLLKKGGTLLRNKLKPQDHGQKMIYYLIAATIPGALAGFLLETKAESVFRSPIVIVFTLIIFGALLLWAEKVGTKDKTIQSATLKDSILVGLAQAVAIIPGTSRSGITITAGLLQGFKKEEAAKFSFMLSAPIILGAGLAKLPDMPSSNFLSLAFWAGMVSSAVFGFLAIKFILKYVQKKSYRPFVYYRFVLAGLILLMLIWR